MEEIDVIRSLFEVGWRDAEFPVSEILDQELDDG